jgi:hypothetical protein
MTIRVAAPHRHYRRPLVAVVQPLVAVVGPLVAGRWAEVAL